MNQDPILIVDEVHPVFLEILEKYRIKFDYKPYLNREEALSIIASYEGLVIRSKFYVDADFLKQAKKLRFIARGGAGLDGIDEQYCDEHRIQVFNAPEGNRDAVGEHMLGMLLSLLHNLKRADDQVRDGQWLREANRGYELMGKTVGLIGYGNNGKATAKKLHGFDVNTLAYDKYKVNYGDQYAKQATMEEIFEQAEVVSFHIPLTEETKEMINSSYLSKFQNPIYLLMGARGGIMCMNALLEGLDNKKILGAAFDVLPVEKFPELNEQEWFKELKARENVLFSPHIAGWTHESYYKISEVLAKKIVKLYALITP